MTKRLINIHQLWILLVFFVGCGDSKNEQQQSYNNFQASLEIYEKNIQIRAANLQSNGLLIPAEEDIKTAVWIYQNNNGSGLLYMNTNQTQKVYNFAKGVSVGDDLLIPADGDLSGNNPVRVLKIDKNTGREITGEIQIAPPSMVTFLQSATHNQAFDPQSNTSLQTEAFFRIIFSQASHSYTSNAALGLYRNVIDRILQNRTSYVTLSSIYWSTQNGPTSSSASYSPYNPTVSPPVRFLDGKINMGIGLHPKDGLSEPINVYLEQSATSFLNPQTVNDALVIIDLNLDELTSMVSSYQSYDMDSTQWQNLPPVGAYNPYHNPHYDPHGTNLYNFNPSYGYSYGNTYGNIPRYSSANGRISSLDSSDIVSSLTNKSLNPFNMMFNFSSSQYSASIAFQVSHLAPLNTSQTQGISMISGIHQRNAINNIVNSLSNDNNNRNPLSWLAWPFKKILGR